MLTAVLIVAQQLTFTPYHANGMYELRERVGWNVGLAPGQTAAATYTYTVKRDGLALIGSGTLDLSSGHGTIVTSLDKPGMLLVEVRPPAGTTGFHGASKSEVGRVLLGAAVAPRQIRPSERRPPDFDAFWAAQLRRLDSLPFDTVLTPGESGRPDVEFFTIRMRNVGGAHIYGQLARPAAGAPGTLPALLILQWASPPYPLQRQWVTDYAAQGWLVLDVEPHDVPPDMPPAFYDALPQLIKDYRLIGRTSRDESYFLPMYLGDYRAAQYLASRADWNGKTLVVMGTSMGASRASPSPGSTPSSPRSSRTCPPAATCWDRCTAARRRTPTGTSSGRRWDERPRTSTQSTSRRASGPERWFRWDSSTRRRRRPGSGLPSTSCRGPRKPCRWWSRPTTTWRHPGRCSLTRSAPRHGSTNWRAAGTDERVAVRSRRSCRGRYGRVRRARGRHRRGARPRGRGRRDPRPAPRRRRSEGPGDPRWRRRRHRSRRGRPGSGQGRLGQGRGARDPRPGGHPRQRRGRQRRARPQRRPARVRRAAGRIRRGAAAQPARLAHPVARVRGGHGPPGLGLDRERLVDGGAPGLEWRAGILGRESRNRERHALARRRAGTALRRRTARECRRAGLLRDGTELRRAPQAGRQPHGAGSRHHLPHAHGSLRQARRGRGHRAMAVQRRGGVRDRRRHPGGRGLQRGERCLNRDWGIAGPSWRCCSAPPPSIMWTARSSAFSRRRSPASSTGPRPTTPRSSPGSASPTAWGCSSWAGSWTGSACARDSRSPCWSGVSLPWGTRWCARSRASASRARCSASASRATSPPRSRPWRNGSRRASGRSPPGFSTPGATWAWWSRRCWCRRSPSAWGGAGRSSPRARST